jgi:hypothetical protein
VGALLLYLLAQFLAIRFENKAGFNWWNKNDGAAYSKYFSLFLLYSYYQGSSLLYWLVSLFRPINIQLDSAAVTFITAKLLSFVREPDPTDPSKQSGILTPKQLCQTVLLYKDDGDLKFAAWLKKHPNRLQGKDPLDPDFALVFPPITPDETRVADYTGTAKHIEGAAHIGKFGVYPKPNDYHSWRGCLQAWANGGLEVSPAKYVWKTDVKNAEIWTLVKNEKNPHFDDKTDPLIWFDGDLQSDNFLGRYHVEMTSPFVTFYVTGKAYLQGVPESVVDGPALDNLIGANVDPAGADPGGWLGFIKGKGDKASADEFFNQLYATVDTDTSDAQKAPCNPTNNALYGGAAAFASSAAMAIPMMVAAPEAGIFFGLLAMGLATAGGAMDGAAKC